MNQSKVFIGAVFELIKTGHWITDQVGLALKKFDASEPQYNVLRILKGQRGNAIAVQDISSRMIQRSSNVTRIIDKLLEKGMVERKECATNRRKMDITITEDGLEQLKKFDKVVEELHGPLSNNITEEEAIELKRLIKKLKGE